ncbi:MAG: membrane-bound lytic murein transglycosylase A [Candidatus Deianiraeaceae bacterium]|jgi:membrane-bound lytic murein transglycosylase A
MTALITLLLFQIATLANPIERITHPTVNTKLYNQSGLILRENIVPYDMSVYSPQDLIKGTPSYSIKYTKQHNGFIPQNKVVINHKEGNQKFQNISNKIPQSTKVINTENNNHPLFVHTGDFYLVKSDWQTMKNIIHEKWQEVADGYKNVCKVINNNAKSKVVKSKRIQIGTIKDLQNICTELSLLKNQSNHQVQNYFLQNFTPYLIGNESDQTNYGTFTGYYLPTLNASRRKTAKYKYPIYKKPKDLTSSPYYTRKEINDGALKGMGLEMFWVDDFVDLYFLHIQGSGVLKLTDGTTVNIKYSAKNNQPYQSLGKYMFKKKYIKNGHETKRFLQDNEHIAHNILSINKSYIFFTENNTNDIIGAHGSALTDERSLAVDNTYIPYGAILFIDTKNHHKIMFAQDTGSAIKGEIRGDIFVGSGYKAGEIAKKTHHKGIMYILIHKNQTVRKI